MSDLPRTMYVKSGEVHIAYQVLGDGSIDLLWVPGFVSHLEYDWEHPRPARFFRRLASFSRLIRFDKRGTGLSDRVAIPTLEERMDDVRAVLDATGSSRAALIGVSEGGPMSLLYAATYPERTSALVLYGSYARRAWAPDHPFGVTSERMRGILETLEKDWGASVAIASIIVTTLAAQKTTANKKSPCANARPHPKAASAASASSSRKLGS